jgi:hypothetical protein
MKQTKKTKHGALRFEEALFEHAWAVKEAKTRPCELQDQLFQITSSVWCATDRRVQQEFLIVTSDLIDGHSFTRMQASKRRQSLIIPKWVRKQPLSPAGLQSRVPGPYSDFLSRHTVAGLRNENLVRSVGNSNFDSASPAEDGGPRGDGPSGFLRGTRSSLM